MPQRWALKKREEKYLLDQGEVFSGVPLFKWKDGEPVVEKGFVVVTSHGCVCEKYERALSKNREEIARKVFLQVAPLQNAKGFKKQRAMIEKGAMPDFFYLEGDGQRLEHQVVDLTREQAVPAELLADHCERVAQVSDWQWEALRLHLTLTRFREPAGKIFRDEILRSEEARDGT